MADEDTNPVRELQIQPEVVGYPPGSNYRVDPADILRRHDEAIWKALSIWTPSSKVERIYPYDELDAMAVEELRILAMQLGVDTETDRREVLVRNCFNAQRIPVVFATPDPAYAAQAQATGRKEGTPTFTVRYPIISIQRLSIVDDQNRYSRPLRRKLGWTSDGNAVQQSTQPNPVLIPYQVEFLTRTMTHMNIMVQWMERFFGPPRIQLSVDLGYPWGVRRLDLSRESSYQDMTTYEMAAEEAEKMIRYIYTLNLFGWIPNPHFFVPTVRKVTYEFADSTGTLATTTTVLEDVYASPAEG